MTIDLRAKEYLALLLAQENLEIIHDPKATTASFETEGRVLTLPVFKDMGHSVYNLLISHEVAHALWTPKASQRKYTDNDPIPGVTRDQFHQYMNVVEDARIEKMIQEKYPGFRSDYTEGYRWLYDQDFFGKSIKSLNTATFGNRLIYYFKVGHILDIPIYKDEESIVEKMKRMVTYDDVFEVAIEVIKLELSRGIQPVDENPETTSGSGDGQASASLPAIECPDLEKAIAPLLNSETTEVINLTIPNYDVDQWIVGIDEILEDLSGQPGIPTTFSMNEIYKDSALLSSRFLMKKQAWEEIHSQEWSTGIVNPKKLHDFQFSEDIFLQGVMTKQGKSHGILIMMDWSNSMVSNLKHNLLVLIKVVQFCRTNNIPVEVYAFSNAEQSNTKEIIERRTKGMKFGDVYPAVTLFQFFEPNMQVTKFQEMVKYLVTFADNKGYFTCQRRNYSLHGTPIDPSLLLVSGILERLKKKHDTQLTSCIYVTDGSNTNAAFGFEVTNTVDRIEEIGGTQKSHQFLLVKDSSTRLSYHMDKQFNVPKFLVERIRIKVPESRVVSVFVGSNRMQAEGRIQYLDSYGRSQNWMLPQDMRQNAKLAFNRGEAYTIKDWIHHQWDTEIVAFDDSDRHKATYQKYMSKNDKLGENGLITWMMAADGMNKGVEHLLIGLIDNIA